MGNKGIATILSAGGGTAAMSAQDTSCKAFGAAVDAFCGKQGSEKKGTFNGYFFEALEKTKPVGSALAESIEGDTSVTKPKPRESIAAAVARGTGKSAQSARRVLQTRAAKAKAKKSPSLSAWSALGGKWLEKEPPHNAPRYPQGKLENTPIEVKAPGDTYEPGKLEEFQSIQKDKKVIEVACEACGEDCAKGNTCK
jgi:hypothetical protein